MPIVYLDSNIYRQLGLKFVDNIDYQNLSEILANSGNEFGLLEVVRAELLDYYKNDIFGAVLNDHEKLFKRYRANPYLPNIDKPDTSKPFEDAIQNFTKDLETEKYFSRLPDVPPHLLLEFLLHNKRLGKKDNTRDFLIFYTLIRLCKQHNEDYVVLISQDDIFSSNEFFKRILEVDKVTNYKLFKTIPDFLKDFGPKIDFVTAEAILESLDKSIVEKELLSDIKCLPSYVSQFYHERKEEDVPNLEHLEIKSIEVNEFYIVRDFKTGELKLNVSFRVEIKAIFKPESQKEELNAYLSLIQRSPFSRHQNNFDKETRPIFESNVLFIFEGNINDEQRRIEGLHFIDFIPDYFISEELLQKMSQKPTIIEERVVCNHVFDVENGYWRHSRYGGGLSWHYRCKKCGLEYDTGDFFD